MAAKGQFHRFYLCIDQIEKAFPLYFDAFLRLRTDTVVLGALPDVLLPDPTVLYTKWRCKLRIRPPPAHNSLTAFCHAIAQQLQRGIGHQGALSR
jgi:hypothetical protein